MKSKRPIIFLTFANDKVNDALYLRNLPKELHGIRTALDKAVKAGLCEVIERTAATVNDIFDTFQDERYKDRIAIMHYGGHASGDLLMLETLEGGHGHSHSEGLVPFLAKQKGLQLVFFNGCSSQKQATELIEEGVPAVIGTATAIADDIATELSTRFYNALASGTPIHQAWLEAIDMVKTKNSTAGHRGLRLRRDKSDEFPWRMTVRNGAEIVKEWNLPNAANNPLFGLPQLPKADLPEEPFRFLRRYEPQHAEIFFGRDRYIRQLYDRITSEKAAPIILFYGQSGAGKSSTLDSGLLPRLTQEADVKYIRRNASIGLLGTLDKALGGDFKSAVIQGSDGEFVLVSDIERQIKYIEELETTLETAEKDILKDFVKILHKKLEKQNLSIQSQNTITRLERWLAIEEQTGRPFHIFLDQVEEAYTRYNPEIDNELEELLSEIQQIFIDPNHRPKGKIILSYRKEYHPEIEEFCKKLQIPREGIFLKKLDKQDIAAVVNGLNSTERLKHRYHITIESDLPAVIADDLLADKDSPIAPVLSILLTKLWTLSQKEGTSIFSVAQYQHLKKEGIMMDDFFKQQMEKLEVWKPDLVKNGLALDVLNFHTTALGTAGSQSVEKLRERYEHQADEINALLTKFKELYLLTDAGAAQTGLAHDTLAPIVIKGIRESDKAGQRALRILTGKVNEFRSNKNNILDKVDLELVEVGKKGMRLWTEEEKELVALSQAKRARDRFIRRMWTAVGLIAILVIVGLGLWSNKQANIAGSNALATKALLNFNKKDYTESKKNAIAALRLNKKNYEALRLLMKTTYSHMYKIEDNYYQTPFAIEDYKNWEQVQFAPNAPFIFGVTKEKDTGISLININNYEGNTVYGMIPIQAAAELVDYQVSPSGKVITTTTILKNEADTIINFSVWNVETEELINEIQQTLKNVNMYNEPYLFSHYFSPQETYLAFNHIGEMAYVLNLKTKQRLKLPVVIKGRQENFKATWNDFNVFTDDDKLIVLQNGTVYDLENDLKPKISLNGSNKGNYEVAFFKENNEIVVGNLFGPEKEVIVYNLNGTQLYNKIVVTDTPNGRSELKVSPNADYFISSLSYNEDIERKKSETYVHAKKENESRMLRGMPIGWSKSRYGYHVVTNDNGESAVHRLNSSKEEEMIREQWTFSGKFITFSPDGKYLITQKENLYINIWDLSDLKEGKLLLSISGEFLGISKDAQYVATTTGVYDLKAKKHPYIAHTLSLLGDSVPYFDANNKVISPRDTTLKWNNYKSKYYGEIDYENYFSSLEPIFSNNNQFFAVVKNNKVCLYTKENKLLLEIDPLFTNITDIRFTANDTKLEVVSMKLNKWYAPDYLRRQAFWIDDKKLIDNR